MRSVRRRVRMWVTTWLVCQFAAVSAFAPRECCEAHRPVAATAAGHSGDHAAAHASHHTGQHATQGAPAGTAAGHVHHHAASNGTVVRTAAQTRQTTRPGMCPMRGPNGEPCPMHDDQAVATGSAGAASDNRAPDERGCVMRGACHGPISAVVTLFLTPADPLGAYTLAADQTRTTHAGRAADPTLDLTPSVFTPPPRA